MATRGHDRPLLLGTKHFQISEKVNFDNYRYCPERSAAGKEIVVSMLDQRTMVSNMKKEVSEVGKIFWRDTDGETESNDFSQCANY